MAWSPVPFRYCGRTRQGEHPNNTVFPANGTTGRIVERNRAVTAYTGDPAHKVSLHNLPISFIYCSHFHSEMCLLVLSSTIHINHICPGNQQVVYHMAGRSTFTS